MYILVDKEKEVMEEISLKYLGVPLDSRNLTLNMCLPSIEKITWSSKLLSYAGRTVIKECDSLHCKLLCVEKSVAIY